MRYTIPVEAARAAVKPTPLVDVLRSLRDNHVIQSFAIVGSDLQIEADPGVELAFIVEEETADPLRDHGGARTIPAVGTDDAEPYEAWPRWRKNVTKTRDRLEAKHAGKLHAETAGAYYRQAAAFMHTAAFHRLSKHRRAIWRLHSQGKSKYEIAEELGCPSGTVARAILTIRPQAGLGRTARSIPRGPQKRTTS